MKQEFNITELGKKELEAELGKSTVGKGGLTVKTTLDYRIQKKAEEAMNDMQLPVILVICVKTQNMMLLVKNKLWQNLESWRLKTFCKML